MSEASVGAKPISGNDRPSKRFKPGHVCNQAGCGTELSIYNDGKYCYQHEPMSVPRCTVARSPDHKPQNPLPARSVARRG